MAKILVITSRYPFPLEKGDKLRVYNQIKYFSRSHEVFLITINPEKLSKEQWEALDPYCKEIKVFVIPVWKSLWNLVTGIFNKLPFQVRYFFLKKIKAQIHDYIHRCKPDAIYSHLIRTSEYVKDVVGISKTIDYMDCFSKGMQLQLGQNKNPVMTLLMKEEYRRLRNYEEAVFNCFESHCIISAQDREALKIAGRQKIEIITNGVDFSIFYPMQTSKQYDVLFSGNMGYGPNIDAAFYAATQVFPLILSRMPAAKMLIAGVNPPAKIRRLANANIEVREKFNHIRDAFAASRVNLVPVITSIGLQNKILQSMAMKIPTVTTPAGARGIDAEGKDILLTGTAPKELAAHVLDLLNDKTLYETIAEKAYINVLKNYSWENANQKLLELILH